ncbi:hypothetical protein CYMTET_13943, partial [Cymbomonas tetramitiformis]
LPGGVLVGQTSAVKVQGGEKVGLTREKQGGQQDWALREEKQLLQTRTALAEASAAVLEYSKVQTKGSQAMQSTSSASQTQEAELASANHTCPVGHVLTAAYTNTRGGSPSKGMVMSQSCPVCHGDIISPSSPGKLGQLVHNPTKVSSAGQLMPHQQTAIHGGGDKMMLSPTSRVLMIQHQPNGLMVSSPSMVPSAPSTMPHANVAAIEAVSRAGKTPTEVSSPAEGIGPQSRSQLLTYLSAYYQAKANTISGV